MKPCITLLILLHATPALADGGDAIGAVISAVSHSMANNNQGDPGSSGGDDDD